VVGEVEASDALQERTAQNRVGSLHAGHDGGLDATGVEAGIDPIPRENQVVVAALIGAETMAAGAGKRQYVSI